MCRTVVSVIKTCGFGILLTPLHAGSRDCYFLLLFILILNTINDNDVFSKSAAVTQEANDASKAPTVTHFLVLCNQSTQMTA